MVRLADASAACGSDLKCRTLPKPVNPNSEMDSGFMLYNPQDDTKATRR